MPRDEYLSLTRPERDQLEKKLTANKYKNRILSRLDGLFQMGVNEKFDFFFEEIELPIGDGERAAIKGRNAMAHGARYKSGTERQLVSLTRAYETLLHRVLLKLLAYDGEYVDYSVVGWPQRALKEPIGFES